MDKKSTFSFQIMRSSAHSMPTVSTATASSTFGMKGLLLKRAEMARQSAAEDEDIILGRVEEFDQEDLHNPPVRIFLSDGKVLMIECPSAVHQTLIALLGFDINFQFNQQLAPTYHGSSCFYSNAVESREDVYFNVFCGVHDGWIAKLPDILLDCLINYRVHRYSSPIVWEIAYKNESFMVLLKELFCWLSPATDVLYACGFKLYDGLDSSGVAKIRIVVIERTTATDPSLLACQEFPLDNINVKLKGQTALGNIVLDSTVTAAELRGGRNLAVEFSAAKLNSWYGCEMFHSNVLFDMRPALLRLWNKVDYAVALGIYPTLT